MKKFLFLAIFATFVLSFSACKKWNDGSGGSEYLDNIERKNKVRGDLIINGVSYLKDGYAVNGAPDTVALANQSIVNLKFGFKLSSDIKVDSFLVIFGSYSTLIAPVILEYRYNLDGTVIRFVGNTNTNASFTPQANGYISGEINLTLPSTGVSNSITGVMTITPLCREGSNPYDRYIQSIWRVQKYIKIY